MVIAYQSAQHRKATSRNCQRDTRISERRARTRNSGKGGWGVGGGNEIGYLSSKDGGVE